MGWGDGETERMMELWALSVVMLLFTFVTMAFGRGLGLLRPYLGLLRAAVFGTIRLGTGPFSTCRISRYFRYLVGLAQSPGNFQYSIRHICIFRLSLFSSLFKSRSRNRFWLCTSPSIHMSYGREYFPLATPTKSVENSKGYSSNPPKPNILPSQLPNSHRSPASPPSKTLTTPPPPLPPLVPLLCFSFRSSARN